jgi:hypothetical protein
MKRTKTQSKSVTPGFAILLTEETNLGIAMLIAEDDAGNYFPIGPVSTIREANEIAREDLRRRMHDLDCGGEPCCPAIYKVWAHGVDGYVVAAEFDHSQL